ncbi:hypothetical protein, partial [Acinetobacter sp.]|uniref:hypothetical protein n=1 Tax=Acinetobacter sp. TaxID=472 RepID=UPI0028AB2A82
LCGRGILNPLCLPISPLGHVRNNRGRNKAWQANSEMIAFFSSNSVASILKISKSTFFKIQYLQIFKMANEKG